MSSISPQQQSFGLYDSPMSPLSSPSSPSFPDGPSSSNDRKSATTTTTVYDVLYSPDNPADFYNGEQQIVTAGCPHLAQYKKQRRQNDNSNDDGDLFTNYRSLVRYSLTWHKSRRELSSSPNGTKRKQSQQV